MSTCPKCNATLNDGFTFCPECGNKIENTKRFCTGCGAELDASHSFCPYCGKQRSKEQEPPCQAEKIGENKVSLKNAIISLVMSAGIMPMFTIFSFFPIYCFFFFPGVILFYCLAIRFANLYEKEAKRTIGFTNASRIVSLVCLILGIVLFIAGIAFTILFFSII